MCYYKNKEKRYWFCSFGSDVYDEVKKYLGVQTYGLRTLSVPILTHSFSIQEFSQTCCAEYCIIFLALMSKGLKYEDIVLLLVKD